MSQPEPEFSPYYLFDGPTPGSHPAGQDLGPLLATYQSPRLSRRFALVLYLSGLVLALTPGAYGMAISYQSLNRYGAAAAQAWSRPWFNASALLLAALAVLWVWKTLQSRGAIWIFRNGLTLRKAFHKPRSLRWREIAGIAFAQEKISLPWMAFYSSRAVLHPNQGKAVVLNGYCAERDLPELVTRLKASLYQHLEPELRSSLKAGQRLYFGPLGLSQEGIQFHKQAIPWSNVVKVSIQSGKLQVTMVGQARVRLSVSQVPNIELFLRLSELACALGRQVQQPGRTQPAAPASQSIPSSTHPPGTS